MPVFSPNLRKPTISHAVLFALILFSCTVDGGRAISILGVSGVGAGTFASFGAVWILWLTRPALPRGLLIVLLPLILFEIDALGTLFWYRPGSAGIQDCVQLVTVGLTFIGVLMFTARETFADPGLARLLFRIILYTSALPVIVCYLAIFTGKISGDSLNTTRPFALYTLSVVAVALASWLGKIQPSMLRRPIDPKSFIPLGWALIIAYVVLLGLSRTALVGILMMIPLSVALRGTGKSVVASIIILALGAGSFYTILYANQNLYNRFFHEDAHMKIGSIAINGTGRTQIWGLLWDNIRDDWAFGKGISSSEDLVKSILPNVGQPHNDYLRFYYDQGVLGLGLWLIFIASLVYRIAGNLRRSIRLESDDYPMHLAALLALGGVLFSMLTDNSVIYPPVMIPLAIVLGCSLGTGAAIDQTQLMPALQESPTHFEGNPWIAR